MFPFRNFRLLIVVPQQLSRNVSTTTYRAKRLRSMQILPILNELSGLSYDITYKTSSKNVSERFYSSRFFGNDKRIVNETETSTSSDGENVKDIPISNESQQADGKFSDINVEECIKLLEQLKTEKQTLQDSSKLLNDKYVRALAETENVRKRMQRQIDDAKQFGLQNFCKDLLEVADVLELARSSVPQELVSNTTSPEGQQLKTLYEGVVMTEQQLLKIFNKHGLVKHDPIGEKFDPNVHEAIFEVPDPNKPPGVVAVVTKTGYLLNKRPIRPAKVGIVKAAS